MMRVEPCHKQGYLMKSTTFRLAALLTIMTGASGCDLFRWNSEAPSSSRIKPELSAEQQERVAQATSAKDAGDYDTALAMFQEILAENPTITTAHVGVGDIYLIKKDY